MIIWCIYIYRVHIDYIVIRTGYGIILKDHFVLKEKLPRSCGGIAEVYDTIGRVFLNRLLRCMFEVYDTVATVGIRDNHKGAWGW